MVVGIVALVLRLGDDLGHRKAGVEDPRLHREVAAVWGTWGCIDGLGPEENHTCCLMGTADSGVCHHMVPGLHRADDLKRHMEGCCVELEVRRMRDCEDRMIELGAHWANIGAVAVAAQQEVDHTGAGTFRLGHMLMVELLLSSHLAGCSMKSSRSFLPRTESARV